MTINKREYSMNILGWKRKGFTIAELLIVMLIMIIVGAALVPVTGVKRIKAQRLGLKHGVYQCFYRYDESTGGYILHSYQQDNRTNKKGISKDIPGGASCSFELQPDSFYTIHGIGAGSPGTGSGTFKNAGDNRTYGSNNDINSINYNSNGTGEPTTGYIDSWNITDCLNNKTCTDIPQRVRDLWLKESPHYELLAGIRIQSAIGKDGEGKTGKGEDNTEYCQQTPQPPTCRNEEFCNGTSAGTGLSGTIPIRVKPGTITTFSKQLYDDGGIEVSIEQNSNSQQVYLSKSGDGSDAWYIDPAQRYCQSPWQKGVSSYCTSNPYWLCNTYIKSDYSRKNQEDASIDTDSDNTKLVYSYAGPKFKYIYGYKGVSASEKEVLFEKVKEPTTIVITPAYPGKVDHTRVYIEKDGAQKLLFEAKSAVQLCNNGNTNNCSSGRVINKEAEIQGITAFEETVKKYKGIPVGIVSVSDLTALNPNFIDRYKQYNKSGSISDTSYHVAPGMGGVAAYKPLTGQIQLQTKTSITNAYYGGNSSIYLQSNKAITITAENNECSLGSPADIKNAKAAFETSGKRCKAGQGEPGAVVIEW